MLQTKPKGRLSKGGLAFAGGGSGISSTLGCGLRVLQEQVPASKSWLLLSTSEAVDLSDRSHKLMEENDGMRESQSHLRLHPRYSSQRLFSGGANDESG